MTEHSPRLFTSADAIVRLGTGLIDRSVPREEWTHEAHLAACLWIVRDRPDLVAERDVPVLIAAYNVSLGGVNSDTEGYHETITQVYIAAVRAHLAEAADEPLLASVNRLLLSDRGQRDWPLRFYTRDRLFSVEARRGFVPPDIEEEEAGQAE